MLLLIALLSFIVVFMILYLVLMAFIPARGTVTARLRALDGITKGRNGVDDELDKPFTQRVLSPINSSMAAALMRFAPQSVREMVDGKLTAAGGFGRLGSNEFMLLCGFLALVLPVVAGCLSILSGARSTVILLYCLAAFLLGLALPVVLLRQKIVARQASIQKNLPDVLDLLTVSVEAGLGFDGALAKLSEKMQGALVAEFSRVLQEIRMGIPRRAALQGMALRCNVPDLSLFTTALVQADQLGVSIGSILRVQAAGIREQRRQRIEEQAMKAPIKMMLPLVLFIFPTIFIVLLGPAVIQIIGALSK